MFYFDHASTTPVDKRVLKKMLPYFSDDFANPSGLYSPALKAKKEIDRSRAQIAKFLNCMPNEIVFTSGGTESDNLAVLGTARSEKGKVKSGKLHIITSQIEHPAVLNSCRQLEKEGFEVTYLPVDKEGIVKIDALKKALRKNTILVSIMYANNEIGTVQPVAKISEILAKRKAKSVKLKTIFHTDACQAAGYLPMDVKKLGVDLLTINGSKIYGPKGIGALYVRDGIDIEPIIFGGGQENGLRSGTENVPAIVGLAAAISLLSEKLKMKNEKLLRDYVIRELLKIPKTKLNGDRTKRLPNNINISFDGVEGESLVLYLDKEKIYTSTGSACSSKSLEPSRVIMALSNDAERAHSSLRITLGRSTTKADADKLISATKKYVKKLKEMSAVQ
jgi:cysteine desulfurase